MSALAMSQKHVSRSTSPIVPSANTEDDSIIYRHDSRIATQAAEITALEKELTSLRCAEISRIQLCAEFLEKTSLLEKQVEREKVEKIMYWIQLEKQRKRFKQLEIEAQDLRESEPEPKFARDTVRSLSALEQASADGKSNEPVQTSSDGLQDCIKTLEEENNQLRKTHESHICEELFESALRKIADAEALQAAAEAEVEGLQHIKNANEKLVEQHDADTQQILSLLILIQRYMVKFGELEEGDNDDVQIDLNTITPPKLDFSAIMTGACITPVDDQNEQREIANLRQRLSILEMEKEELLSDFTKLSNDHCEMMADFDAQVEDIHALYEANVRLTTRNENLVSQLEVQTQLLHAKDQETEQQVAHARAELTAEFQAKIDALDNQRQRTHSTFSDPEFVASLRDPENCRQSFSQSPTPTVPCRNPCCFGSATSASVPAPNRTLNITLSPSDTGLWSLLRHIRRTVFRNCSLNIDGPRHLTEEFLASIEEADQEFAEQSQRVTRLERAVMSGVEEIERLKEKLR